MKALIVYFSATGNTKIVVDELQKTLNEHDIQVDVGKITSNAAFPYEDYDIIGVATPVMSFKPTYVVKEFVDDLPLLPGKMTFAVGVHGGMGVNAHHILARWLKKKGMLVLGDLEVWGENSFVPARRKSMVHLLRGKPDRNEMAKVRNFGVFISVQSKAVKRGEKVRPPFIICHPHPLHFLGMSSNKTALRLLTGNKHVDQNRCTKCGFCAVNCPVDAIEMTPWPNFNNNCFGCWSCINNCPEQAILTITSLGGEKFPGLHRPEVKEPV